MKTHFILKINYFLIFLLSHIASPLIYLSDKNDYIYWLPNIHRFFSYFKQIIIKIISVILI